MVTRSKISGEAVGDSVELRTWEGMSPTGWAHKSEAKGGTKRGRRVAGWVGPCAIDPEKGRRGWVEREGRVDGLKMKFLAQLGFLLFFFFYEFLCFVFKFQFKFKFCLNLSQ